MHMPITCSVSCCPTTSRYLTRTASIQSSAANADQIFGLGAVPGQRQRMGDEAGVLQPLVHRAQVVLRATQAVDQEYAWFIRHA